MKVLPGHGGVNFWGRGSNHNIEGTNLGFTLEEHGEKSNHGHGGEVVTTKASFCTF